MSESPFTRTLALIDQANSADPNREIVDGRSEARELLYSRRMTRWIDCLVPDASETLRLAARAQHICRWTVPRASYPAGRSGYLKWRRDLGRFHADKAAELMRQSGYDDVTIERVRSLLRKEKLKSDAEVQSLEDAACLVFLETGLTQFAARHEDDKVIDILRKTWGKMSPAGHEAALQLHLDDEARNLLKRALET